jgi:Zn-dependent peptidase ImmA (M78 family)
MKRKSIEKKSNKLLVENLNNIEGPIDIIELAQRIGFRVGLASLPNEEDGFIIVDNDITTIETLTGITVDKVIGINSKRDLQTKRFIIAHEIGHYILHYETEESGGMYAHRENRKGKDKKENEADFFAACLLMPKKSFKERYDELKRKDVKKSDIELLLQNYFNVPKESVERRIEEV